jgi:hypothetical protein
MGRVPRSAGKGKLDVQHPAVLNATGSHLVASRHPDPWLNESDLQQVADFVISSHRE